MTIMVGTSEELNGFHFKSCVRRLVGCEVRESLHSLCQSNISAIMSAICNVIEKGRVQVQ